MSSGTQVTNPESPHPRSPLSEVEILWLSAGLSCDGDTIAMTGATQPSIEDVLHGAIPGLPKVTLHNPFLSYDVGDDFVRHFHRAAEGAAKDFISSWKARSPTRITRRKDIGRPLAPIR